MNPIFTKMVDAVEAANAAPDDYINSADGLKYCGKCRTPKEAFYPADLQAQGFTKHPVMCSPPLTGGLSQPQLQRPSLQSRGATRRTGTSSKRRGSGCSCSGMSARESPMPLAVLPMF